MVLAVQRSPALTWVSVLLGVPATVLLLIQAVTGSDDLLPYSSAFEAVLYFYAAGAMIAYMLADHEITRDELFAVGATFTLVAWAFAYTYTVCQAIEPGSFTAAIDPSGERSWMELLFLSFTTLTSTGLSDVVPVKPFARGLVMLEQVAGLAYVAMLVSRLVGLTIFSDAARTNPAPLWDEDALPGEHRVVLGGREAVGAAVEDLDLAELPDRSLSLAHGPRQERIGGRRDGAGRADRRVGRPGAGNGHREGEVARPWPARRPWRRFACR